MSTRTSITSALPLSVEYEAWNRALCDRFFNASQRKRPVYLQVESEVLADLAPGIGIDEKDAERNFLAAVRQVYSCQGGLPFGIRHNIDQWRESTQRQNIYPPFVAVLGICVLAASKMAADDERGIGSQNYYVRLNELLGCKKSGRPDGFEQLTGYWQYLQRWLDIDNNGAIGLYTASPLGRLRWVGYPISQSLLRDADKRRLANFFEFAHIVPGDDIDPADLLDPLIEWCGHAGCRLSARAKRLITRESHEVRRQIAEIVAAAARDWDGEIDDVTGRRVASIALQIRPQKGNRTFDLDFYPRRPSGFPDGVFRLNGHSIDLTPIEGYDWYEPIPVRAELMLDLAIELQQRSFSLRWIPKPVLVAKPDFELGDYVSQPRAELGQLSLILCQDRLQHALESFLHQHARSGWQQAQGTRGLPSRWRVFTDVVIESRATSVMPELDCLVPDLRASISLQRGLKLDKDTWLAGAEPTLIVLPRDPGSIEISVDGQVMNGTTTDGLEMQFPLAGLAPGEHQIKVNDRSRHFFTTRSGDYDSPSVGVRPPMWVHALMRRGDHYEAMFPSPRQTPNDMPPQGEIWVIGGQLVGHADDLPESLPEPIDLPGGAREYFLIGRQPGMVFSCRDPKEPQFRFLRRPRDPTPFTVQPPFRPNWVIMKSWRNRWRVVPLGEPQPPLPTPWPVADTVKTDEWAYLITRRHHTLPTGRSAAMWREYIAAAKARTWNVPT